MTRPDPTVDTIVASFGRPDLAKAAMAELERAGIGPNDITLLDDVTATSAPAVLAADDRKVRWIARRWVPGAVAGAVIGALLFVGALAVVVDGSLYPEWIGAAVGGAVAGAFVGGLLWVGATMPRNPDAWDTHLVDEHDDTRFAVRLQDSGTASTVSRILRRHQATTIDWHRAPRQHPADPAHGRSGRSAEPGGDRS
jgi:hypothetical protein